MNNSKIQTACNLFSISLFLYFFFGWTYLFLSGVDWRMPVALTMAKFFQIFGMEFSKVPVPVGGKFQIAKKLIDVLSAFPDAIWHSKVLSFLPVLSLFLTSVGFYFFGNSRKKKDEFVRGSIRK